MTTFSALLTSLPTGNSTLRMRVWRALKSTGCGVLRDGVYILPVDGQRASAFGETESAVRAAGGFAMNVELNIRTDADLAHVRGLFDRSAEYGTLVERISAARAALRRLGRRRGDTLVQRLRRAFDELAEIDFYPGEAQSQAKQAITALEGAAQGMGAPGEPHSAEGKVRRLDAAEFRNRLWATRRDLWVDRLASVWFIRRFIDRNARFVWIDRPRDRPRGAIGFDFDGARFTHVGNRVTFEVLVTSFGLDADRALVSLGNAIHFLDVGGIPVADARGLEIMLKGIKGKARNDDEMASEAARIFDFLYAGYAQ